ncbi:POTRA domain protein, FtsQ-type [Eubacterium ramulus ATCC 29099]|uniref:POTRA domain protein, FtsQ-type n=2 Tax=Eubacterium ramulus TaxID=39490 RepID=U2QW09_EUBRA|nr:POTRA domain protein, FtsQ-type [Eubacterium ramulus ATCC 29099]
MKKLAGKKRNTGVRESVRKRRKRRKIGRMILTAILIIAMLAGLCAILIWKVFVVKSVSVKGNEIYTDKQIEDWVLDKEYSWNSLYVYFENKCNKTEEIPFVDSLRIRLKSPQKLEITVVEKGILGYLYVPSLGKNAYFDKDGFVVEISSEIIPGVTKINGLSVQTAELYKKLSIGENSKLLRTLLSVTQLLKKYERVPEVILIQNSNVYLSYGAIQVNLGSGTDLNEKILRMDQILLQLDGMSGMLHLETWSETNTDIYFRNGELVEIPNDVQTVPTQDDSTQQ